MADSAAQQLVSIVPPGILGQQGHAKHLAYKTILRTHRHYAHRTAIHQRHHLLSATIDIG